MRLTAFSSREIPGLEIPGLEISSREECLRSLLRLVEPGSFMESAGAKRLRASLSYPPPVRSAEESIFAQRMRRACTAAESLVSPHLALPKLQTKAEEIRSFTID